MDKESTAATLWRLYDADKKLFFNSLTFAQLRKIIEGIPKGKEETWHICKDGGDDWYPLKKSLDNLREPVPQHIQEIETVGLDTYIKTYPNINVEDISNGNALEQRKMQRIVKKIPVYIDVGDQILTANTQDISLVAIKLDKKFPIKYRGHYYSIILKTKPSLELRCTPLYSEPDYIKGIWSRVKLHPNFNLKQLIAFLGAEK